jgi:hypothetical protein
MQEVGQKWAQWDYLGAMLHRHGRVDCSRLRGIWNPHHFRDQESTKDVQHRQNAGVNPQTGVNGTFVVHPTARWDAPFRSMQRA